MPITRLTSSKALLPVRAEVRRVEDPARVVALRVAFWAKDRETREAAHRAGVRLAAVPEVALLIRLVVAVGRRPEVVRVAIGLHRVEEEAEVARREARQEAAPTVATDGKAVLSGPERSQVSRSLRLGPRTKRAYRVDLAGRAFQRPGSAGHPSSADGGPAGLVPDAPARQALPQVSQRHSGEALPDVETGVCPMDLADAQGFSQ